MLSSLHEKSAPQIICETCMFKCSKQSDYNRHILTRKHEMLLNAMCKTESFQKPPQFNCEKCNFTCNSKCDYDRHINTNKHKREEDRPADIHSCDCGSTYKHYSSYYRHKKTCKYEKHKEAPSESPELYAIIQLLIKENQDTRNAMITQTNTLVGQNNTLVEQNKTLTEIVNNRQPTTNNSHNTTNSHNNYNINMFLTDKCKDAHNMSDFIEVLKNKVDMLMIEENGYVGGISKLFIEELKSMQVTERPIHCTDERRNTFYVHNNDTWNKDEDLKDTKNAIGHISQTNLKQCVDWSKNVPQGGASREEHITRSIRLCKEACSGDDKNTEKIIKNISKEIPLNKQVISDILV